MRTLFALLVCASTALARTTNHYEVVKQATVFALQGGFTGRMSASGESMLALSNQKDAVAVFTKLTQEPSPAAKLYGLLGLKLVSTNQFNAVLRSLLTNKQPVQVLEGCMMGTKDVGTVGREIQQGRWSGLQVNEIDLPTVL